MTTTLIFSCLAAFAAGAVLAGAFFSSRASIARQALRNAEDNLLRERAHSENLEGKFHLAAVEALKASKADADASLDNKKNLIEASVGEMKSRLESTQRLIQEFEKDRREMQGKIDKSLAQVLDAEQAIRTETTALKNAFSSSSSVRGNAGEWILEQIFEQYGFVRGQHFDTQVSLSTETSDVRPDFVVYLPGGKKLAIDSKELVGEYLLAQQAQEPALQNEHLAKLVVNIRNNFTKLSRKEYQDALDKQVPFVVMFVSSESAIRAAYATDPRIFKEAADKRVVLASPMTIIPLIHLIKYSWDRQKIAENAMELAGAVEVLGARLFTFINHLNNIRSGIEKAEKGWNDAVGSWQRSVAPQIQRTKDLGGNLKDAEDVSPLEISLRPAIEDSSKAS